MIVFKSIIAALQFLTVLPLPVKTSEKDLNWGTIWFPLVGAGLGTLLAHFYRFLAKLGNFELAVVLTIFAYIALTRGLHLDGLMDTVDGFFSGKAKAEILVIMREPAVGSFAVLAAGIWFFSLFSGLSRLMWLDMLVVHMLARHSILWLPLFFSYPGKEGTGRLFIENTTKIQFILATLLTLLLLYLSGLAYIKYFFISVAVSLATGWWAGRKIGGVTGDVCGFIVEANHVALLVIMAISSFKGG